LSSREFELVRQRRLTHVCRGGGGHRYELAMPETAANAPVYGLGVEHAITLKRSGIRRSVSNQRDSLL